MLLPSLFIKKTSNMGKGVFSNKPIPANTIIEIAPVIVMPWTDKELLDKTFLYNYIFEWGYNKNACCMALGYIPMYNHTFNSNCDYVMDYDNDTIEVKTMVDIGIDEQLFINYNGSWDDCTPIWFETL